MDHSVLHDTNISTTVPRLPIDHIMQSVVMCNNTVVHCFTLNVYLFAASNFPLELRHYFDTPAVY